MLHERFAAARTFPEFLEAAEANAELWAAIARRARAPEQVVERVRGLPGRWRLLVLLEDWCGDAVNTVPVLAALADAAPNLELRVLGRDANPDLTNAHLTGGSRSIPVAIVLDEDWNEVAWWGPRPAELQGWFRAEGMQLPAAERYAAARRWYARDRGESTLREIVCLIEEAAACLSC